MLSIRYFVTQFTESVIEADKRASLLPPLALDQSPGPVLWIAYFHLRLAFRMAAF
jgi:hypothetical protein